MGQNPAVGSPNGKFERSALGKLKWLVVRDMVETETASFWRDAPEVVNGDIDPEDIDTEVFFFPAASHAEKDGAFTNTQRMLQWHEKAVEPPGDARSELQFMIELGRMMKERAGDGHRDAALRALSWDYEDDDADAVLREIQGYDLSVAPAPSPARTGGGAGATPSYGRTARRRSPDGVTTLATSIR